MMKIRLFMAVLAAVAFASPLQAQGSGMPAIEARVGGAIPRGDLAAGHGPDAGAGYGLGLEVQWPITRNILAFAGYHHAELTCGSCGGVALEDRMVDAGPEAGVLFRLGFGAIAWGWDDPGREFEMWARGGVIRRQLKFFADDRAIASDPGFGYTVGGGVAFPLGDALTIAPGVHYRSYRANFAFESLPDRSQRVAQLGVELGISYSFRR